MPDLLNYLAGRTQASRTGRWFDVYEPATGEVYARAPESDANDMQLAVDAARAAFPAWRDLPAAERAAWLNRIADLVERDFDEFARAESQDTGKPLSLARSLDIPRAI